MQKKVLSSLVILVLGIAVGQYEWKISQQNKASYLSRYVGEWVWQSGEKDADGNPAAEFDLTLSTHDTTLTGSHCFTSTAKVDCDLKGTSDSLTSTGKITTSVPITVTSYRDDSTLSAKLTLNDPEDTLTWDLDTLSLPAISDAYLPQHTVLHRK